MLPVINLHFHVPVFNCAGKSFGEALGMMFAPDKSRKKSSQGSSLQSSPSTSKCTKSYSSLSDKKVPTKTYINSPSEVSGNISFPRLT